MPTLHFHGHATFSLIADDGVRLLVDPFFTDNPQADMAADEVEADYVLCTHGHGDHFGDALDVVRRTGAKLIASYEIVQFAGSQGVDNAHPMHIGGGFDFPFGRVKMTPALHGGAVAGDETGQYTTNPAGFLIHLDGKRIYLAGDTALTMDMQLLRGRVDVAVLPIGDNFTTGPEDAVRAVDFIEPSVVVPFHFNTWELIEQDPAAFAEAVGDRARVEILEPGQALEF